MGCTLLTKGDQAVTLNAVPNSQCLCRVMETIPRVMKENNLYAIAFNQMHTVKQEENCAMERDGELQTVRLFFKRGSDCRRYHRLTHN